MHAGKSRYQDTLTFIQKITKVCTIAPVEHKDLAVALQHNSGNMPIGGPFPGPPKKVLQQAGVEQTVKG